MAGRSGSRSGADNDNEDWENGHWTGPTYPLAGNQPARADASETPTPPRRPGAAKAVPVRHAVPTHVRPRVPMPPPRPNTSVAPNSSGSPDDRSSIAPTLPTAPPQAQSPGRLSGYPGSPPGGLNTSAPPAQAAGPASGYPGGGAATPPAAPAPVAAPPRPVMGPPIPRPPVAPNYSGSPDDRSPPMPPSTTAPPGVTADGKSMYGLPTGGGAPAPAQPLSSSALSGWGAPATPDASGMIRVDGRAQGGGVGYAKGGPAKGSFAYAKGGAVGDTKARYKGMTHKR